MRRRYRRPRSLRRRIVFGVVRVAGALVLVSAVLTLCLRWVDPPTTSFMLQSHFSAPSARKPLHIRHYWVGWDEIAEHGKLAVVAAEDQRFPSHRGFDLEAVADAVYEQVKTGRQRGASTISQQVAKNLYLWPGKSYLRKGLEAYFTALIELTWPKRRILEMYLNIAQFGDGVFGIEAASVKYYGKPSARLTRAEAARLAAVLPNPVRHRLDEPASPYLEERAEWIEVQMERLGRQRHLRSL